MGDFASIWEQCRENNQNKEFRIHDGFLFKHTRLCIPQTSLQLQLIREVHAGGLAGHFEKLKTLAQLEDRYYRLGLKKVSGNQGNPTKYRIIHTTTSGKEPWSALSMDFVLGLRPAQDQKRF